MIINAYNFVGLQLEGLTTLFFLFVFLIVLKLVLLDSTFSVLLLSFGVHVDNFFFLFSTK